VKKTNDNLMMLNVIFVSCLIVANVVGGKVVDLFGFVVPAAVVAYGLTFLCTDVIGEIWGKETAKKTVKLGLVSQLLFLGLLILAMKLPPAVFAVEYSESFSAVLGQSARMVLASLSAYFVAQFNDVFIFHKLKDKTKGSKKWLRNNISTMMSQMLDTAIFITIAFYGVVPNLGWMIISQYVVKLIIAGLDTPFFYWLTKERG